MATSAHVTRAGARAIALLASLLGCTGGGAAEAPNVVVVLIDALRADRLGSYGYSHDTSPHIDALAAESLRFENTFAQSPWTKPSIPTLFTSLYPIQHGVYEGEAHGASGGLESDVLAEGFTTLAEAFQGAGYRTVGIVNNAHLEGRLGFAQGFDEYQHGEMRAPEICRHFLEFLDAERAEPFFAYIHYLDVHWPFQPSEPFRSQFPGARGEGLFSRSKWTGLRDGINGGMLQVSERDRAQLSALHDGGLAQLDHEIGRLVDALRERGLLDRTILLLTSDHGEELLDHGKVGHGGTLFREVIDIPLLIRLPHRSRVGVVSEPARLLDVFPTLLRAAGIEPPAGLEGRDLLGGLQAPPEIVAETRHGRSYTVSVRREDWKFIRRYRALRIGGPAATSPDAAESFGLSVGGRVKVKGELLPEGSFQTAKLRFKQSADDDLELSGPIASIDRERERFSLLGYSLDAGELLAPDGGPLLSQLSVGQWVKAEGELQADGEVEADKLEPLAQDDHDVEIEGIILQVESISRKVVRVRIGHTPVLVTGDTKLRGAVPTHATREFIPGGTDPFSPDRLRSGAGLEFDEQLFDLAGDPREQNDVAGSHPERVEALRAELLAWLARMSGRDQRPVNRQALDPETVKQLRELGYVE